MLDPAVANDVTLSLQPIADWSHVALDAGRVSAAKTGTVGIAGTTGNPTRGWSATPPGRRSGVDGFSGNSTAPIYDAWGSPNYGSDLPGKTWKLFMDTYLAGKPALPMATRQLIVGGTNLVNPPKPSTSASSSSSDRPNRCEPDRGSTRPSGPTQPPALPRRDLRVSQLEELPSRRDPFAARAVSGVIGGVWERGHLAENILDTGPSAPRAHLPDPAARLRAEGAVPARGRAGSSTRTPATPDVVPLWSAERLDVGAIPTATQPLSTPSSPAG